MLGTERSRNVTNQQNFESVLDKSLYMIKNWWNIFLEQIVRSNTILNWEKDAVWHERSFYLKLEWRILQNQSKSLWNETSEIFAMARRDFHRFFDVTKDASSVPSLSSYENSAYAKCLTFMKRVYPEYGWYTYFVS